MAKKGENIYHRKDGRWEGKYVKERVDGRIRYGYVSGNSYEEVLLKKQEAINACWRIRGYQQSRAGRLLFSTLSEAWLYEQEALLKESSMARYRDILEDYLLPAFGSKKITEITKDEVQEYVKKLLVSGGIKSAGLAPGTVMGILSILKRVFEYAEKRKNLKVASLRDMSVKKGRKPLRVLSISEQSMLEEFLLGHMDFTGLGIMLCLYTGIRLGELCALKWEDISFQDRTLHIHGTMARIPEKANSRKKTRILVTAPKSDSSIRYIPIPDKVFRLLKKMAGPENAYILTGTADEFIEPRTMENHFRRAVKNSGIEEANFHALRHTFATRCVELGFDAKSLSEILGHASVSITMDRYVHPTMETKQKNMDRLSSLHF